MSVIILSSRSDVAEAITDQGLSVEPIASGKALLVTMQALNATTMQAIYRNETWYHIKHQDFPRSVLHIGDGYFLRIVHDSKVMGPSGFLNVNHGSYTAPWGVWTLYKGNPSTKECYAISKDEAEKAYMLAKTYTHTFSSHHMKVAQMMNYLYP